MLEIRQVSSQVGVVHFGSKKIFCGGRVVSCHSFGRQIAMDYKELNYQRRLQQKVEINKARKKQINRRNAHFHEDCRNQGPSGGRQFAQFMRLFSGATESFRMDDWDVDLVKLQYSMKKLKVEKREKD